jgi:hypothetical protein
VDGDVLDLLRYKYADLKLDYLEPMFAELSVLSMVSEYRSKELPSHEKLKVLETNYLEEKYAAIENACSRLLAPLKDMDWPLLKDTPESAANFYSCLLALYATQLFRTAKMRTRVMESINALTLHTDKAVVVLSEAQKETFLKLVTYIESLELAMQLERDSVQIDIHVNDSEIKFLTSSAPAHQVHAETDAQKKFLKLGGFMPLSPSHFMMVRKDDSTSRKINVLTADPATVGRLNSVFIRNSGDCDMYSTSEEALKQLRLSAIAPKAQP